MFETLTPAPRDAILGITEAFNADTNPHKINLSVGVYKDAQGRTPILPSVKEAERRILETEATKNYLGISGAADFAAAVQNLILGDQHEALARVSTAHTPGGTAALRVAADFLATKLKVKTIWVSDPTWPNHPSVFQAAGLAVESYPYFDAAGNGLAFDRMLSKIDSVPAGDAILLHGCCHNPTGIDPTPAQWKEIAQRVHSRGLIPLIDLAYLGFAEGLREDAAAVDALVQPGKDVLIATSFSKNFGLYNERVGALLVIGASRESAEAAMSHVKVCIRANYSNPPAHGSLIVTTVLRDSSLRKQWEQEVADMRSRIHRMRTLFVDTLKSLGVKRDFSFIARQRGMFSFSGLSPEQCDQLRDKHALYVVRGGGRINVAGMTEGNMPTLCSAIADVLSNS